MHRRHLARYLLILWPLFVASLAWAQGLGLGLGADSLQLMGPPSWVLRANGVLASVDLNFQSNQYYQSTVGNGAAAASFVTTSRASSGTDLLPTSASGASFNTFSNNVARVTAGVGLLVEEARTNQLLNSTAPATQTTGALGATAQTLWVNGSGSAVLSNGSATGCVGTATNGSPVTFTPTAGTCTVTVSGSLNAFQLEAGAFGTSLIVTAGVTATRAADVVTLTNVPAFGSAYSMFGKGTPLAPTSYTSNQYLAEVDDGTTSNRLALVRNASTGQINGIVFASGAGFNTGNTIAAQGASTKAAIASTSGSQALSVNGGAVVTGAIAVNPSLTAVRIGNRNNDFPFNGLVERIALWPTVRLPNASLQAITQ